MLKTEIEARTKIEDILSQIAKGWKYAGGDRRQSENDAIHSLSLLYVVPIIEDFDTLAKDLENLKLDTDMSISFNSSQSGLVHGLMESEILTFKIKLK